MKKRPLPQMSVDDSEAAQAIALNVERSAALVRELMTTPVTDIVPPRFLTWRPVDQGLVVTTDKAVWCVSLDKVDAFCLTLGAMIRAEFRADWSAHGNC